jgi:glycosyltransferase involved in cell wall biosynthesis
MSTLLDRARVDPTVVTGQTVLYVLKRFPRLSETFILREVLALEAAGVNVLVDALLPPEDGPTHPELAGVQARVRYLPRHPRLRHGAVLGVHLGVAARHPVRWAALALRSRRDGTWRRFVQAGLVASRIRRDGAGHVHAHFATAASEVATMAARLAGVTCSVTAHAKDIYHRDNAPLLARRLAGADTVVTVSGHNVEHLNRVLAVGGRVPDVRHIANGVPLGSVADPTASLTLLCVARLVPKKGVDLLMEAAALLLERHPQLAVDIIGDGPLRDELAAQIDRLGLVGRVRLLGVATTTEVLAAMATARAVVLPCRIDADGDRDGMPTVLVEALARGIPVVSTDIVGIRELVKDGETGLLVEPEDVPGLAAALDRLLVDPLLAARLGDAGRRLVGEQFGPADSTRALAEVFAATARTAGSPAAGR